jgi:hypothetical protein
MADPFGSFTVDVTAASSFQPLNVVVPAALIRPALTGDLTQYSPAYLWANGYGMRPDPAADPNVYAVWASSVTSPARGGDSQTHPMRGSLTVFDITATAWSGGALIDSNAFFPSSTFGSYLTTFYVFNAPSFNLSSQPASCTAAGIWGGLGGIGGSLIQTGIVAASLDNFFGILEPVYQFPNFNDSNTNTCYGSVCSFSFGGLEPDDLMLGQSWSCDSNGDVDMNGDFGCFYLADVTQSMYGTEILEKENTFLGESAEVVIENVSKQADFCGSSGQFYEFGSSTMDLAAQRTDTGSLAHQFSTDDALQFNIDGGLDEVSIDTSSYDTTITWIKGQ